MADNANTAAGDAGKADLTTLAQEVQMQAIRALHLLSAIDDAIDDATDIPPPDDEERRLQAVDQMVVFSQIAREAMRKACDAGEAIERYDYHARQEGAAA